MHLYCFWVRERMWLGADRPCERGPVLYKIRGVVAQGSAAQERKIAQEGRGCARERVGDS